jgi:hypothetical protein
MIPELEIEGLIGGGPRATAGQAYTIAQAVAGSLMLGIKANNSDGPITIGADENLSVEISLSDEGYVGKECDWWVVVSTPSGIQYLDLDKGFVSDFTVTHQGVIFDLGPTTIFNISGLDAGTYVYYFGIDLDMNGELDMDEGMFYYDSVEVRVEDGSGNKYADTDELLPPTGFNVLVSDNTLTLSWDAVSGAEGYTLYYGTSTGDYTGTFDLGNSTGMVFEDMPEGTYYLAITAYAGPDESGDSEEIGVTVSE